MTEKLDESNKSETAPEQAGGGQRHSLYSYKTAGITEREGRVPPWLWVVVASLLIWGAYYIVSYWYAPASYLTP